MDIPNSSSRLTRDISFHLASNDRDLVEKVSSIMKRNGHLTFCDSMGKEHYLVDGRSGVSSLSRNIDGIARKLTEVNMLETARRSRYNSAAIEKTMTASGIPNHLRGHRYIRIILIRLMENESLISPLSKTIYPEISEMYQCSGLQIDRDIRYAVSHSGLTCIRRSPKAFVCLLFDMAKRTAIELEEAEEKCQEDER